MVNDIQIALIDTDFDPDSCKAVAHFRFDKKLQLFEGHFPGDPILPGVHQIEMVRTVIEKILRTPFRIQQVKSAKFTRKVLPSEELEVLITDLRDVPEIYIKATIKAGNEITAKIKMRLEKIEHVSKGRS